MQWSLEDIYKKQVRGKIPPRKHLRVLGEAQITLSYDEEGIDDEVIEVKDKDLRNISGYYKGTVQGTFLSDEDAKVIEALAVKCGFEKQYKFLKLLFTQYKVDYDILKKYVDEKDRLTVLGSQLQGAMGKVDLWEICAPQLSFVKNPEDRPDFYNSLFTRKFEEGNVSVGAGELALAVLTEAKKATTGDLLVGSLDVEVKTGKGRVISSRTGDFAKDNIFIQQIAEGDDEFFDSGGLDKIVWNTELVKKALTDDNLRTYVIPIKNNKQKRLDTIGALLTHAYGGHGNPDAVEEEDKHGFDIILAIFQKERSVKTVKQIQRQVKAGQEHRDKKGRYKAGIPGTFYDAKYVNVKDINQVIKAVHKGYLAFGWGGHGVYIQYPGAGNLSSTVVEPMQMV